MVTRHTLVTPLIVDKELKAGYQLIEFVREQIRAHFAAQGEFPSEVALPLEKFRQFEKYYPDWVAAFNRQNPTAQFAPQKNQNHQIIFGMTTIVPRDPREGT